MFPETSGRTLEELTFCKCTHALSERYVYSLLADTSKVYESDREALRHDGVETLREHGETETCGTMEDNLRRTARSEQG
jgi:hypothetical protein